MLIFSDISPRYQKYRTHAHSYCSSAKRITARRSNKHCVYAERCRRANNCPCVADIRNILKDCYPFCTVTKLFNAFRRRSLHSAQHSSCQLITRKLRHQLFICGIYGDIAASFYNFACSLVYISSVSKQGYRLTSRVECHLYNRLAFRYKYSVLILIFFSESCIGKMRIYRKLGDIYIININYYRHNASVVTANFRLQIS